MASHNNNQPLIKIIQPSFQAEKPTMQTIFHYRKPNRDKINKKKIKDEFEDQHSDILNETIEKEIVVDKLNFEIIEPVSHQSTNFTLFDLSQDPDLLIKNLMDTISNSSSNFDLNSIFNSGEEISIESSSEIELKAEQNPNLIESISIIEMAQDVLQDILKQQQKRMNVVDIEPIHPSGPKENDKI